MWFIGDILLNGLIALQNEENKKRFHGAKMFFEKERFVFANLETPIFEQGHENSKKKQLHTTSFDGIEMLKEINVFGVSLANNHIFDCSEKGLRSTIQWLKKNEIKYTGAGFSREDIKPIVFHNSDNEKVAFFAYVDKATNPCFQHSENCKINYLDIDQIKLDIIEYRQSCDKIIISLHWGIDYINYISQEQYKISKKIIDLGADIIVGHHSHVIQPYLNYNNKHIFFGIGGFVFGDFETKKGMESSFQKTKSGLIINVKNNHFRFFKSRDKRNNRITIEKFDQFLAQNKKRWTRNLFFFRNKRIFNIYVRFELSKMKLFHLFFAYQNNPMNRLLKKLYHAKNKKI